MKYFFKIIFSNTLIIIVLLLIGELCSFLIEINVLLKEGCFPEEKKIIKISKILQHYYNIVSNWNNEPYQPCDIRKPVITTSEEKNIYLLGCSFAYGHQLKIEETIQYKLAKQTKKNVYNLAISSTGPREMLHILRNKKFLNENNLRADKSEYFIYIIIDDHYRRLIYDLNEHAPHYKKENNNKLILLKNKIFYCSYLYRQLKLLQYRYTSKQKLEKLFNLYIEEINKEIKSNFKNSQNQPTELIILDWSSNIILPKQLEEQGIRVLHLKELIEINLNDTEYYISKNDCHPNAKAWEVIAPALVKELNL